MEFITYAYEPIHLLCKSNIEDLHPVLMKIFSDNGVNSCGFNIRSETYWAKKEKDKKCLLYFTIKIQKHGKMNELIIEPIIDKNKDIEKIYNKITDYIYVYEVVPSLYKNMKPMSCRL